MPPPSPDDSPQETTGGSLPPDPRPSPLDRVAAVWPRLDALLYPVFAGVFVLYAARTFYGSMHQQTHGNWSAPLDDVFIHFDYARATARGYPFQWSEGNGFSSGNTSLTYPFALALGYLIGFRSVSLMLWAAMLAAACTLGFLLVAGRLADPLGRWAKYLIPPAVLSLGALDWSLFSGMENAFHLGIWALVVTATLDLVRASERGEPLRGRGWLAGLAGALLFATRPESVVCVATLGIYAAVEVRRTSRAHGLPGGGLALATLFRIGLPGAFAVAAQALANRIFTGEWAANGAISKLTLNDPYMPAQEKWWEYLFLLRYVIVRNTEHHFAEGTPGRMGWGWLVVFVAAVPLFDRRTRKPALVLWTSAIGWLALVALNRQVRWQNERYTMSAVAWILVLFAMGLAIVAGGGLPERIAARLRTGAARGVVTALRVTAALALVGIYWWHQLPQMRDQVWFFGRASRNIRDQHLVAGERLAKGGAQRVLVGDAGALMYASDLPGVDLIGLGGYRDLPFARAGVHGLGASLELIERLLPNERPDAMALYPDWWGDLPTLFGRRVDGVTVYGNVICGGAEKVLYKADWSALERSRISKPRVLRSGEKVVDELDVADLISEKEHRYDFPHPSMGFVDFRVLADARDPRRDLFDAGRQIPAGKTETARVHAPPTGGRLVVRTAVGRATKVAARIDGRLLGEIAVPPSRGSWTEASIDLPAGLPAEVDLALTPVDGDWLDCHVWLLASEGATVASP